MHDPFETYLNDHLAGANFAISLLEDLKKNANADLASFTAHLLEDIQADHNVVEQLVYREGKVSTWKKATGHLAEWASRIKRYSASDAFAEFESLELLAVGIQGKLCLWRALAVVAEETPALRGIQLEVLAQRAMDQYQRVEARRLDAARTALAHAGTTATARTV